jgi:pimeloyl-ACP methyl ester carboxylesterase
MTRSDPIRSLLLIASACGLLVFGGSDLASAQAATAAAKPTIVLVHGAFADALGWQRLIPILQRDGYEVLAVENPLASLDGDVETTKRFLGGIQGPIVLVGHSYGGAVITGAAAGNPNVKALVYLAAFAPEGGEAVGAFGEKYPADLGAALKPDSAGFLYVDRARFRALFCADVPEADARVAAVTQKPLHAKRMGAKTSEIKSSHVAFISHPDTVAKLIEEAATASGKK